MMHEEGLKDMKVVIDVFNLWLINGLDQLYRFSEGSKEHLKTRNIASCQFIKLFIH